MLACLWEPKCQKDILSNCHINCLVFLNCHISYWPHTCRKPPLFQRCIFLWPQERSKANSKIDYTLKFPCHSTPSTIQQSFNNPLVTLSLCQRFHESSGNKLQCSYLTWQSSVGRQVFLFVPSSCFTTQCVIIGNLHPNHTRMWRSLNLSPVHGTGRPTPSMISASGHGQILIVFLLAGLNFVWLQMEASGGVSIVAVGCMRRTTWYREWPVRWGEHRVGSH